MSFLPLGDTSATDPVRDVRQRRGCGTAWRRHYGGKPLQRGTALTLPAASHNRHPPGCSGSGEGWAEGPSRRDAQRPSGDPLQPASSARCGSGPAAAWTVPARCDWAEFSPHPVPKTSSRTRLLPSATNAEFPAQRRFAQTATGRQSCRGSSRCATTSEPCSALTCGRIAILIVVLATGGNARR
jgi:hypothetical protein